MRFIFYFFLIILGIVSAFGGERNTVAKPDLTGNSIFKEGVWYKMAINKTGMYRITYSDLQALGVNTSSIDPQTLKIYGNGGQMLPEDNSKGPIIDSLENAIRVVGEEDGRFDVSDYILFYAQNTVAWTYNTTEKIWEHQLNEYSDTAYYFLTFGGTKGKRVSWAEIPDGQPTDYSSSYDYRTFHEWDRVNIIKSGRTWLGEDFDVSNTQSFSFTVPNISTSAKARIKVAVAARASASSIFQIKIENATQNLVMSAVTGAAIYASYKTTYLDFVPTRANINLEIAFNRPNTNSSGWVDYIDLTARAALSFASNEQLGFRDVSTVGAQKITEFSLQSLSNQAQIWDVTDLHSVKQVQTQWNSSKMVFSVRTDTLKEFIAFENNLFKPLSIRKIANQNLHALEAPEMLIISPPEFYDQAIRLASFHASIDAMNVQVVDPSLIYNEFSFGMLDPAAIRNFAKYFYKAAPATFRYLLLFGDGSFDNKSRISANTNRIPTYQAGYALNLYTTLTTDDYYGCFDWMNLFTYDSIRLGIGRLPIKTAAEAEIVVDKIIHCSSGTLETKNDWRNVVAFIADDDDYETYGFVSDAEALSSELEQNHKPLVIDKIYLDAYKQQNTASGPRYPDANAAITQRVEKGALFINYTGHGGATGLADEHVLSIPEIRAWKNQNNQPIFVTATCDFTRFDDPSQNSAGEEVLLNPVGGGIALFSTTRPTFGTPNFLLNRALYQNALLGNGGASRLGDIIRKAKQNIGLDENSKKFALFGDPALRPAYPEYRVITTAINSKPVTSEPDTLKALQEYTIEGEIVSALGEECSDFNGFAYPTIFDKFSNVSTLGNDGFMPYLFQLRKNVLFKGKVEVKNGKFSYHFIIPKDIDYQYDFGKIVYYACSEQKDAGGYYENIIIGGSGSAQQTDHTGPQILLYLNDRNFRSGGVTDNNPYLLAFLSDETAINTSGVGIGHNIVAILDNQTTNPIFLNNFYEPDVNTLKSGSLKFPLFGLSQGKHTLSLKAWDIYNNSSEATIEFEVVMPENLAIGVARCFPNPFQSEINITVEHNQQGKLLHTTAFIYSMKGEMVRHIEHSGYAMGTLSDPIIWDGKTDQGNQAAAGIYACKIIVASSTGQKGQTWAKIVYIK